MDFTPLRRHRDYRYSTSRSSVSFLGTMMTYVALPYQMFQLTHSSFMVGLLGVAELIPLLMTAFVGGALADSVDRRRMVIVTDVFLACGSLSLVLLAWHGAPPVWSLYVLAGFMSGMNGLQRPSIDALMPRLVPREDLMAAAALGSFRGSFIMIVGPAIGGILIASMGLAFTYAMDVLSYVLALGCIVLIRRTSVPEGAERPTVESIREGFRYARSRQELVGHLRRRFRGHDLRYADGAVPGPVREARRAGSPRHPLCVARGGRLLRERHQPVDAPGEAAWPRGHRRGRGVGCRHRDLRLLRSILPAAVFLALAGGADAISGIFRSTMWNQTIPDHLRGRLAGIEMVSYMSGPMLGHLEAGMAAAAFGVRASVVSGGVLCVIGVAVCAVMLPKFISYDADEFRRGQGGTALQARLAPRHCEEGAEGDRRSNPLRATTLPRRR